MSEAAVRGFSSSCGALSGYAPDEKNSQRGYKGRRQN